MNSLIIASQEAGMMIIQRLTSATGRHVLKIPFCRQCGDACTVCAPKFGQPTRCCLSSQLARREGQIKASTPPEHPYDGESGETFDAQVFAGKPE